MGLVLKCFCLDIFAELDLELSGPVHVYVHIASLSTDPYALGFAKWTFPQTIPCLINSLDQLHFRQCFMETLHYTRHRKHLAFCVRKTSLMIRRSTLFI